jgi:hypothetical protein
MKDWGWAGSAGLETRGRLLLCVRVVSESHAVSSYLRLSAAGKGLGEDTARARTRRANRSHPSVAPMLGSRAWKKRPQHALLVGTRYSPSRKPFLKRRGRVLRYLMRPVPVVRRPMALTDQLSVEKKTRGAEGQWPPGGDAVGARERLAVGQIHLLGRGERRTPRGDAVGARERLRVKCHAQDGGAARVRHFAERKNSRALREREICRCRAALRVEILTVSLAGAGVAARATGGLLDVVGSASTPVGLGGRREGGWRSDGGRGT